MDEGLVFLLSNELPIVTGAVHAILAHPARSSAFIMNKSRLRQTVINAYVTA